MAKWNVPADEPMLKPLEVSGYTEQTRGNVDLVNENKVVEELVLRQVDRHVRNRDSSEIDQAMVQLARRNIQEAFMWLNRAVFQPKRLRNDDFKVNETALVAALLDQ